MIKLIVALGNPGKEYEFTRHNIAWLSFDEFFESQKNIIWKNCKIFQIFFYFFIL